jgi:hypothetical protein
MGVALCEINDELGVAGKPPFHWLAGPQTQDGDRTGQKTTGAPQEMPYDKAFGHGRLSADERDSAD